MEPFELSIEALRARRSNKWNKFPADVLPAWVADMDFSVPEPVHQAIARLVEQKDYGYSTRVGEDSVASAFAHYMNLRFGWQTDPARVLPTSELIQAIFSILMAFSEPGDGVVVQTPIYPPFLMSIDQTGRRMVDNPLRDDGTRYVLDIEGLRKQIDDRTRILLFCNPHNPTGRVMTREDLLAVGQLAVERDLLIISDEIHADLLWDGAKHIPMATLSREIADRTITITSATKSYNIPGLRCALIYFGSEDLQRRFHKVIPDRLIGQVNIFGVDATVAAWRHGLPWLETVLPRLRANRERVATFLAQELPEIHHYKPEGTYLSWLDCRGLNLPLRPYDFFAERAKVGFNDGAEFGAAHGQSVRLNFATSATILDQILERMATAVRAAAKR